MITIHRLRRYYKGRLFQSYHKFGLANSLFPFSEFTLFFRALFSECLNLPLFLIHHTLCTLFWFIDPILLHRMVSLRLNFSMNLTVSLTMSTFYPEKSFSWVILTFMLITLRNLKLIDFFLVSVTLEWNNMLTSQLIDAETHLICLLPDRVMI